MRTRITTWLTLTHLLGAGVCGCSNERAELSSEPENTALKLGDGAEIVPESLRCIYRQATGASDELSLQLQYLSSPGRVAFAAYLTNPVPATPFVATPRDVDELIFEAFSGPASGNRAELTGAELSVQLDELPPPSSLSAGDVVALHGQIALTDFALPATKEGESPLQIVAAAVGIDCEATFQLSQVLD